jgi:hypothetical protein
MSAILTFAGLAEEGRKQQNDHISTQIVIPRRAEQSKQPKRRPFMLTFRRTPSFSGDLIGNGLKSLIFMR